MKMRMIVAIAKNGGIGFKNTIPWILKSDLRYFKEKTIGNGNNAIVMGKKTWLSLPQTKHEHNFLPKRDNIILSKRMQVKWTRASKGTNGGIFLSSIEEMKKYCEDKKYDEVWIIGGESIYKQMLYDSDLQDIHVTKIDKLYKTDTYFPNIPPENFSLLSSSQMLSEDDIDYRHMIYKRRNLNNVNKNDKLYTSFPRYGGMLPTLPTKWTVHL